MKSVDTGGVSNDSDGSLPLSALIQSEMRQTNREGRATRWTKTAALEQIYLTISGWKS